MKLSIWQQFSSNHSNSFTVVGTFSDSALAEEARRKLQDLIKQIYLQGIGYDEREPLQAEMDAAREYQLNWTEHLDWLAAHDGEQFVIRLDNTVFLGPMRGDRTWQGALMLDTLMTKLGASTVIKEEEMSNHSICADVHADATDEETAQRLHQLVAKYVEESRTYWADFGRYGAQHPHIPWVDHHPVASKQQDSLRDFDVRFFVIGEGDESFEPKITLEGTALDFNNLSFGHELGYGLPSFVNWLRAEGCVVTFTCRLVEDS